MTTNTSVQHTLNAKLDSAIDDETKLQKLVNIDNKKDVADTQLGNDEYYDTEEVYTEEDYGTTGTDSEDEANDADVSQVMERNVVDQAEYNVTQNEEEIQVHNDEASQKSIDMVEVENNTNINDAKITRPEYSKGSLSPIEEIHPALMHNFDDNDNGGSKSKNWRVIGVFVMLGICFILVLGLCIRHTKEQFVGKPGKNAFMMYIKQRDTILYILVVLLLSGLTVGAIQWLK